MKKLILAKISCIAVLLLSNAQLGKSHVYYEWWFNNSNTLSYTQDGWLQNPGGSFVTLYGPNSPATGDPAGGMSLWDNNSPTNFFDASGAPVQPIRLVITARLGQNHSNGVPVRIGIGDDTKGMAWDITGQLNKNNFTTVTVTLGVGTVYNSGPNLSDLRYFQVEADKTVPGTFELEIQSMAIIPEPHQVAVASLLLLGLGAVVVRRKLTSRNNPVLA